MNFPIPTVTINEQESIVLALKNRSPHGVSQLYKKYTPILTALIHSFVKDYLATPDLLQEVFVKIIHHIDSYHDKKGTFSTWVIRITKNHCLDYLRSKNYKKAQITEPLQLISENENIYVNNYLSLHADIIDLRNAIALLPDELRNFIQESYFNGLTHQQIADNYNYPLGTVKSKILKTNRILRKRLKQQ